MIDHPNHPTFRFYLALERYWTGKPIPIKLIEFSFDDLPELWDGQTPYIPPGAILRLGSGTTQTAQGKTLQRNGSTGALAGKNLAALVLRASGRSVSAAEPGMSEKVLVSEPAELSWREILEQFKEDET